MAREVQHLSDIPDTRKFGSKYSGHRFKRYDWSWGRGAKSRLRSTGKQLKQDAGSQTTGSPTMRTSG